MSEMVERVVEAMRAKQWERGFQLGKAELEEDARAAIAAMREPTPEMIAAAKSALQKYINSHPELDRTRRKGIRGGLRIDEPTKMKIRFEAMIDEALKVTS